VSEGSRNGAKIEGARDVLSAVQSPSPSVQYQVQLKWRIKIPLRDGVALNATLYQPEPNPGPCPTIFTLTPYVGQTFHDRGVYFAQRGFPFLTVDSRGRGDSEGSFRPFLQEAQDAYDIVEWLAQQPFCNGKVAMWGGSYAGYAQWAAASQSPPHLNTIVPAASPYLGMDMPMRGNIFSTYLMQWLGLVTGRTSQEKLFADRQCMWNQLFVRHFQAGAPYKTLDSHVGNDSESFQEWIAHPQPDDYWDNYNPTSEHYSQLQIPILTITGIYDGDQPGALTHYREHLKHASDHSRDRHYLVIGPWDHAGTRTPRSEFAGIKLGPAAMVDLGKLHLQWYAWTLKDGARPEFLQDQVAYYVTGAETWRYAHSLDSITSEQLPLYLDSNGSASDVFSSGLLRSEIPAQNSHDLYVYDPSDVSHAQQDADFADALCLRPTFPTDNLTDQRQLYSNQESMVIYHSAPFEQDLEVSGFFKLHTWISIDQPDTDFVVSVYEIGTDASSLLLTADLQRARYRASCREAALVQSTNALCYRFESFTFTSRLIRKGSRLRLTVGPINSIFFQKNYNSGGAVSDESVACARTVTVKVLHGPSYPSVLYVPLARPGDMTHV
jgi:putative CocE/NonD family hydrolase